MIKQSIMLTEMSEVKWNRYMRSPNSGNSHGENYVDRNVGGQVESLHEITQLG